MGIMGRKQNKRSDDRSSKWSVIICLVAVLAGSTFMAHRMRSALMPSNPTKDAQVEIEVAKRQRESLAGSGGRTSKFLSDDQFVKMARQQDEELRSRRRARREEIRDTSDDRDPYGEWETRLRTLKKQAKKMDTSDPRSVGRSIRKELKDMHKDRPR